MTSVIKKLDKISIVLGLAAVLFLSAAGTGFIASNSTAFANTGLVAAGD